MLNFFTGRGNSGADVRGSGWGKSGGPLQRGGGVLGILDGGRKSCGPSANYFIKIQNQIIVKIFEGKSIVNILDGWPHSRGG